MPRDRYEWMEHALVLRALKCRDEDLVFTDAVFTETLSRVTVSPGGNSLSVRLPSKR